jgi:hypothetical protein
MKRCRHLRVISLIALMVLQGCIFEPREAQPPDQGAQDTWIVPNSPKDVFLNLASGLALERDSNYERSLDPTFTFIPRPEDAALPGLDFSNWTKDVELQVLSRMKSDYPVQRTIQFGTGKDMVFDKENVKVSEAEYEGPYVITLTPSSGVAQTYAGKAHFTVRQGSQGWVLVLWQDYDVNGNYSTSGYLRGTLRSSGG